MRWAKWGIGLSMLAVIAFLSFCQSPKQAEDPSTLYQNLNDSVAYVGMDQCRACHEHVYQTYIHTGMGLSFDMATKGKSAAEFGPHALVYDSLANLYYKPYWKGDSLMVKEFRVAGGDTIHKRVEHIAYIVGSGQHTNSHMFSENGFVHQIPITYYTQQGKWDLAPGFEGGNNTRFSRAIGLECMTCHNGLPEADISAENKYEMVPRGIDCERCHGPGEIHVKEKLAGNIVDTSQHIDYTIVNPADLSAELQMDLCQRCHLQGIAVLNDGQNFHEFKPGMKLSDIMHVFLPRFTGDDGQFLMASQADRLRQSTCYINAEMSCITCHDPHISVKNTPIATFNNKCQSCHAAGEDCTEDMSARMEVNDDCSGCHMPKSGAIDIPHVTITDHFIRKDNLQGFKTLTNNEVEGLQSYLALQCMTTDEPSPELMAKGYIKFYESFSSQPYLLDSAAANLAKAESPSAKTRIHLAYLQQDYTTVVSTAKEMTKDADAWTYYRIGEAYNQLGDFKGALDNYQQAIKVKPLQLEFQNKLGSMYVKTNQLAQAQDVFSFILKNYPKYEMAHLNLGYIYAQQGELALAEQQADAAIALDPDYINALLLKANLLLARGDKQASKEYVERVFDLEPGNEQAMALLMNIGI